MLELVGGGVFSLAKQTLNLHVAFQAGAWPLPTLAMQGGSPGAHGSSRRSCAAVWKRHQSNGKLGFPFRPILSTRCPQSLPLDL